MILKNITILIFADDGRLLTTAQETAQDARLARSTVDVKSGGIIEAAAWLNENPSPDVLIVGDPADETIWNRLEALAESVEPLCKVIIAGRLDSVSLYRDLVAQGLSDYIAGSITPDEIIQSIARQYTSDDELPKGNLIVVVPASGGAGASTVAAVMADGLAGRLGETILLDLDLTMGTAGLIVGAEIRDAVATAIANPGLDASMLERFIVREGRLKILSTPGSLREGAAYDGDTIENVITLARTMAKVVVTDMPNGWGEGYERAVTLADEVIIVTAPDLASLRNCRMMVDDINGRRVEGVRAKVVLNKTGLAKANEYGPEEVEKAVGVKPSASIPWDPEPLIAAVADGKPVFDAGGKTVAALKAFTQTIMPTKDSSIGSGPSDGLLARFKAMFSK